MINIEDEVYLHKLKLSNIYWQQIKFTVTTLILGILLIGTGFLQLVIYAIVVSWLFNTVVYVYLAYLKKDFPIVEFLLIYLLNVATFVVVLITAIKEYVQLDQNDYQTTMFLRGLIVASLQKEIDILAIMIFPYTLTNRQVNTCTSSTFVFLVLSLKSDCHSLSSTLNLNILVMNFITLFLFTLLNLLIAKFPTMKQQIRNFLNLSTILLVLSYVASYVAVLINLNTVTCPTDYLYVVPINLLGLGFIVHEEYTQPLEEDKERLVTQSQSSQLVVVGIIPSFDWIDTFVQVGGQKQSRSNNKQWSKKLSTLKSQQSQSMNSQSGVLQQVQSMHASVAPTFPVAEQPSINNVLQVERQTHCFKYISSPKNIEKLGTSQFGDNQMQGMLHSWANVQNNNPFFGTESVLNAQLSQERKGENTSKLSFEESIVKRDGDDSFHVANPMDSGSQLTVK